MGGTGAGITAFLPDSTVSISGGIAQGRAVLRVFGTYGNRFQNRQQSDRVARYKAASQALVKSSLRHLLR